MRIGLSVRRRSTFRILGTRGSLVNETRISSGTLFPALRIVRGRAAASREEETIMRKVISHALAMGAVLAMLPALAGAQQGATAPGLEQLMSAEEIAATGIARL